MIVFCFAAVPNTLIHPTSILIIRSLSSATDIAIAVLHADLDTCCHIDGCLNMLEMKLDKLLTLTFPPTLHLLYF